MTDTQIHWFSIVNSLLILIFLTGMVAMIIMRTLHADFRRFREMNSQEESQEEIGWKLVAGDVFRPPSFRLLLSVLVGSGVQIFAMGLITLVFALLGFLSPANRGALITAVVVLFLLMAFVSSPSPFPLLSLFLPFHFSFFLLPRNGLHESLLSFYN